MCTSPGMGQILARLSVYTPSKHCAFHSTQKRFTETVNNLQKIETLRRSKFYSNKMSKNLLFTILFATAVVVPDAVCMPFDGAGSTVKGERTREKRADDPSVAELKTMVQQQAQAIQTLQSQMTAVQNQQTALENRLPASFKPVAFTAHFSHDDTSEGVHLNPHQILQFDSVVTNIGNGYNSKTGIFTAPVSGAYVFFLTVMGTNGHSHATADITKQGARLERVWVAGSGDSYDQGSGQVAVHLSAGEQVWVQQSGGDAVRGGYWTVFTGYLAQAD